MEPAEVLPSPVFEGSEKRIELDFYRANDTPSGGLRAFEPQAVGRLARHGKRELSRTPAQLASRSHMFVVYNFAPGKLDSYAYLNSVGARGRIFSRNHRPPSV